MAGRMLVGLGRCVSALGLLLGLFEAVAIIRWDVLMDDPSAGRIITGVVWGGLIMGLTGMLWTVLERSAAKFKVQYAEVITAAVFLPLVFTGRFLNHDRYNSQSLAIHPLALGLSWKRPQRLTGLTAVLLGLPALWGRVPNYTSSGEQLAEFFAVPVLAVVLLGALRLDGRKLAAAAPVLMVVLLSAPMLGGLLRPTAEDGPNLLFVLVDTLRRDHVQPYGDHAKTPSFDRLAREGALFEDAITVIPKTPQSVATFFTGRYPVHHHVRRLSSRLESKNLTLAEILSQRGYDTGAFVHNGWIMRQRGFEQGFDQFWSYFEIERPYGPLRYSGFFTALDGLLLGRNRSFNGNTNARTVTDRAISWIEGRGERPWYAYVHYFDPHWPYRPPGVETECTVNNIKKSNFGRGDMIFNDALPPKEHVRPRELYAAEVEHNFDQIGRLLDSLDDAGIADDTIVVFTADHGHHLGDHTYYYHHGEFLYEPGLRIPLAMRYPKGISPGKIVSHQTSNVDVLPTLLALMGIEAPENLDGTNALAAAPGPAFLESDVTMFNSNRRRFVRGTTGKLRGLRTAQWKLIYTPKPDGGLWELFNLETDRGEKENLIGESVPLELMREMAKWLPEKEKMSLAAIGNDLIKQPTAADRLVGPEGGDGATGSDEQIDDLDRDMLRALGYVR
jgi:arylsulfatase A-like enzyme